MVMLDFLKFIIHGNDVYYNNNESDVFGRFVNLKYFFVASYFSSYSLWYVPCENCVHHARASHLGRCVL